MHILVTIGYQSFVIEDADEYAIEALLKAKPVHSRYYKGKNVLVDGDDNVCVQIIADSRLPSMTLDAYHAECEKEMPTQVSKEDIDIALKSILPSNQL